MHEEIIDAIKNRQLLTFTCSGVVRTVQPAALGVSFKGNRVLRGYQVAGGQVAPGHAGDLFDLADLSDIQVSDQRILDNPPSYKRYDMAMMAIFAQL